jgi:hypothetical protein
MFFNIKYAVNLFVEIRKIQYPFFRFVGEELKSTFSEKQMCI